MKKSALLSKCLVAISAIALVCFAVIPPGGEKSAVSVEGVESSHKSICCRLGKGNVDSEPRNPG